MSEATVFSDPERKSIVIAALMWLVAGAFGVHHFYLGNRLRGLGTNAMLLACASVAAWAFLMRPGEVVLTTEWPTAFTLELWMLCFAPAMLEYLVSGILLPSDVRRHNEAEGGAWDHVAAPALDERQEPIVF